MSDARILDRGYRPYDGPRAGVAGAIRSLAAHTARRMLGLRRPLRWKLLPLGTMFWAFAPAIAFIGFAALFGARFEESVLPQPVDYYGFITLAMLTFAYLVAPQALCPDRRDRILGLYLASPLTRDTYLLAKAISVGVVLLTVTMVPPLLLTVAYWLLGIGPRTPVAVLTLLVQVVGSGLVLSTIYGLFALAVSSLTERVAFAAAGMVLASGLLGIVAGNLAAQTGEDGFLLLSINVAAMELVLRIYADTAANLPVSTLTVIAANAAWAVLLGGIAWLRYRFLRVTR